MNKISKQLYRLKKENNVANIYHEIKIINEKLINYKYSNHYNDYVISLNESILNYQILKKELGKNLWDFTKIILMWAFPISLVVSVLISINLLLFISITFNATFISCLIGFIIALMNNINIFKKLNHLKKDMKLNSEILDIKISNQKNTISDYNKVSYEQLISIKNILSNYL